MTREVIPKDTERRLWADSMGRCMNPSCEKELFSTNIGDIAEKAHIVPYSDTADNSLENLIILCPNCHTSFDKNSAFNEEEVKGWKVRREEKVLKIFTQNFDTFEKLEEAVKPIFEENKTIYRNYFLKNNFELWKKFEKKILINNNKLKLLLENNKKLIQRHDDKDYSNLEIIEQFLLHINEFNETREDKEKFRAVLFPEKINSIFGVSHMQEFLLPSVLSLECLITKMTDSSYKISAYLDEEPPYLSLNKDNKSEKLYLEDTYRLRQLYSIHKCFRKKKLIRLKSLCFILKWLKNNNIIYKFHDFPSLNTITIKSKTFLFVYEYCLSCQNLECIAPSSGLNIINLYNFNNGVCISGDAYNLAENMQIKLFTTNDFYKYAHEELK